MRNERLDKNCDKGPFGIFRQKTPAGLFCEAKSDVTALSQGHQSSVNAASKHQTGCCVRWSAFPLRAPGGSDYSFSTQGRLFLPRIVSVFVFPDGSLELTFKLK